MLPRPIVVPRSFAAPLELLLVAPVLLSACSTPTAPPNVPAPPSPSVAAPPPPPVPPAAPAAPVAPPPHRTALSFGDDPIMPGPPLVDAVVGGQPARLIVDTGASHHVIAGWVAREIGAGPARPAGSASAHGGEAVAIGRLDGIPLSISGFGKVDAPTLLVTEVPDEVQRRGIGGVISPQALPAAEHGVLLDFIQGSLVEGEARVVREAMEAKGTSVAVRRCAGAGAGALVVRATVEGEEVGLQLDTGAVTTSIGRSSPLGMRLGKLAKGQSTHITASGRHTVSTVPDARVSLGPYASTLNLDLIPRAPAGGCGDGFAGMDVLRSCVLLIAGDDARLWCSQRP